MLVEGLVTRDHQVIVKWVQERDGKPVFRRRFRGAEIIQELEISFSNSRNDGWIEEISWKAFFDKFEKEQLVFVYQERTNSGELSHYYGFL